MYRLLVLSVAVGVAVGVPLSEEKPVTGDGCVSWDDEIAKLLLEPLQQQMKKSQSEFITVGDEQTGLLGFGVTWKNGKAGNFSSLQLNAQGGSSASTLCTTGNVKTLTVNLGFENLEAAFDSLTLYTPFIEIGGSETILSLKGENLEVEISTTTDPTTKKCTAQLGTLLFNRWGALELDLGSGLVKMLLAKLFNAFASTRIIGVLETFDVGTKIDGYAIQYLTPVMSKYSDIVCAALG